MVSKYINVKNDGLAKGKLCRVGSVKVVLIDYILIDQLCVE